MFREFLFCFSFLTVTNFWDRCSDWSSQSCNLISTSDSDYNIKCFCENANNLANFGGFVSSATVLPVTGSPHSTTQGLNSTSASTTTTTPSTSPSESSNTSTVVTESSTSSAQCEVGKDDTVFLVVYIVLGISIFVTAILFLLVMLGIR